MAETAQRRRPAIIPWGLLGVIVLYGAAVTGFLTFHFYTSTEYQASRAWSEAQTVLGHDEGRKASVQELERAYRALLEAARLIPEEPLFHQELERLNARFEERHAKVPYDLRMSAEAVAGLYERIRQEREPLLVSGWRERGWAPDQWRTGPQTVLLIAAVGLGFLLVLFAYRTWEGMRERSRTDA